MNFIKHMLEFHDVTSSLVAARQLPGHFPLMMQHFVVGIIVELYTSKYT